MGEAAATHIQDAEMTVAMEVEAGAFRFDTHCSKHCAIFFLACKVAKDFAALFHFLFSQKNESSYLCFIMFHHYSSLWHCSTSLSYCQINLPQGWSVYAGCDNDYGFTRAKRWGPMQCVTISPCSVCKATFCASRWEKKPPPHVDMTIQESVAAISFESFLLLVCWVPVQIDSSQVLYWRKPRKDIDGRIQQVKQQAAAFAIWYDEINAYTVSYTLPRCPDCAGLHNHSPNSTVRSLDSNLPHRYCWLSFFQSFRLRIAPSTLLQLECWFSHVRPQASGGQPHTAEPTARSISSCSLQFEWSLIAFPTIWALWHTDAWDAGSTLRSAFYIGNKTLQACVSRLAFPKVIT